MARNTQEISWWRIFWRIQLWVLGLRKYVSLAEINPNQGAAQEWIGRKGSNLRTATPILWILFGGVLILTFRWMPFARVDDLNLPYAVLSFWAVGFCIIAMGWAPLNRGLRALAKIEFDRRWDHRREFKAAQEEWSSLRYQGLSALFPSGTITSTMNTLLFDWEQAIADLADLSKFDLSSLTAFRASVTQLISSAGMSAQDAKKLLGTIRSRVAVARRALNGRDQLTSVWIYVTLLNPELGWRPEYSRNDFCWDDFFASCAQQLDASQDEEAINAALGRFAPLVAIVQSKIGRIVGFSIARGNYQRPFYTPRIDTWEAACRADAESRNT